ncbi:MAG: protein MraZ [Candidatus Cloacimonadaceae bacterium]|nr:protein MraZ [Candidatus Cloacimonadaceae bacterium]MDP3113627.1 protein MraZ [Candidatus Cloacimonadaceae bacterium]
MSGQFTGYFENSVHKQRVIIPAAFKKKFAAEANRTVVVTLGPNNTIAIYPLDCWYSRLERLATGGEEDQELRTQMIDFAMTEQELEGPGRIRIYEQLLIDANITDKVIIKGELHYITLWNPEEFQEVLRDKKDIHRKKFSTKHYQ